MARVRYTGGRGRDGERRGASSSRRQRTTGFDGRDARRRDDSGRAARSRPGRGAGRGGSGRPPRDGSPHTLLNDTSEQGLVTRRNVVLGVLGVGLGLSVLKLFDYQIANASTYRGRADSRRLSSQTLFAKRGTIYDRNGNVLTSSVECQNVYVNPKLIEDADAAVDVLVEVLRVDADWCREQVTADTTFNYIKRQVDQEDADLIAERGIVGIEFEQSMKRVYPYGNLASQVLGVVNVDNVGLSGLEVYYDEDLTGTNGSIVRERGRDGSFIAGGAYEKVSAQDGTDLVLTLDVNIQTAAEQAIADAVTRSSAKNGSMIVLDPTTGEILAACSSPTFNPTDLANTNAADMNLRIVTDAYEPGSVFKTVVSSMAIDLGLMTPDTTFTVPAKVKAGDDWVTDVDNRDYQMEMTLREILRRSSNTGMVLVGNEIGADNFAEYLDRYGFGESTGIDFPGEATGIVRERDAYDGSSVPSMSFGQGISLPPVAVARAVAAIANGGVACTPHFLKSRHGEAIDWSEGEKRIIEEETAQAVTSMMVTVVDEGTGSGGAIDGYDVAGKTGTAERADESGGYTEGKYMASFMAFASASDPKVLVYATLDDTSYLSYMASPAVKEAMEQALQILGVKPTM